MSDIREDFEAWYVKRFFGAKPSYNIDFSDGVWLGFQAGRAHNMGIDENLPNKVLSRYKSRLEDGVDELTSMQYAVVIAYGLNRAHDIEGLIAEIEYERISMLNASTIAHNNALRRAIEIIRKHFGEE